MNTYNETQAYIQKIEQQDEEAALEISAVQDFEEENPEDTLNMDLTVEQAILFHTLAETFRPSISELMGA